MPIHSPNLVTIRPARRFAGSLRVPGDKSISHRALMLAALADGTSEIRGLSTGEDVQSTAACLRHLGVHIESAAEVTVVTGRGLHGLQPPQQVLDAGHAEPRGQ